MKDTWQDDRRWDRIGSGTKDPWQKCPIIDVEIHSQFELVG